MKKLREILAISIQEVQTAVNDWNKGYCSASRVHDADKRRECLQVAIQRVEAAEKRFEEERFYGIDSTSFNEAADDVKLAYANARNAAVAVMDCGVSQQTPVPAVTVHAT